ncbi:MAG: YvcK family protein [Chloroflexi bacterium]|nr:YvcK family protein [Chloroflexota bacterium]
MRSWLRDPDTRKWLVPGMGVKRWFLLLFLGMGSLGLGVSFLAREAYLSWTLPNEFYYLTLQFMPQTLRGGLFIAVALILVVVGVWKFNHALLSAVRGQVGQNGRRQESLVNLLYRQRIAGRGPQVVTIGGGTGMSVLLRGLKEHTENITAIVTVADDGGSSGRLRDDLGIIPPGDVRNCIAALADAEPLMTNLFQYRFPEGAGEGLEGHSFGNLFIVAMSEITGSMEQAIRETSRVLAVKGQILPSTLEDVRLKGVTKDGRTIRGESAITAAATDIREVSLEPQHPAAYPDAVNAIRNADFIIVGPGSLFTSVLPNLLVPDLRIAFQESRAMKAYVSNVATQHGETDHYSVQDHLQALEAHIGGAPFDFVLANDNLIDQLPPRWQSEPVRVDPAGASRAGARIVSADVVDVANRYRHDPRKLADTLLTLYDEQGEAAPRADEGIRLVAGS